jgi:hypothetical protein
MRRVSRAARVTGNGVRDSLDMLKHALDAPEAAACEDRDLRCRLRVCRLVEHRRRDRARPLCRRWENAQREAGA